MATVVPFNKPYRTPYELILILKSRGLSIVDEGKAERFESWLTIIIGQRNACCHHSRVWNKKYSIRPTMPAKTTYQWITLPTDTQRIYFTLCIIKYFLNIISPNNDIINKIKSLFQEFNEIDISAMGFPTDWETEPIWQ